MLLPRRNYLPSSVTVFQQLLLLSGDIRLPVPATIVLTADNFIQAVTTYQHLVLYLTHCSGNVHLSVPVTTALTLHQPSLFW